MSKLNITPEDFKRVNNDVNGNPRYVVHFLNVLTSEEQEDINKKARPFQGVSDMYMHAVNKARKEGGKKYTGKDFGGGIVFQSYNLNSLCEELNKL